MAKYECIDPIMWLINLTFYKDPDPTKIPFDSIFVFGFKGDEYVN